MVCSLHFAVRQEVTNFAGDKSGFSVHDESSYEKAKKSLADNLAAAKARYLLHLSACTLFASIGPAGWPCLCCSPTMRIMLLTLLCTYARCSSLNKFVKNLHARAIGSCMFL